MAIAAMVMAASTLVACTSDEGAGLAPMYQTTHYTLNDTDCASEGPDVTDTPYFRFAEMELFGQVVYTFEGCSTSSSDSCSSGDLGILFRAASPLTGQTSGASYFGGCELTLLVADVTDDGTELRIEAREYREQDDQLAESQCQPETAESRGNSMPCLRYQVIAGEPLM